MTESLSRERQRNTLRTRAGAIALAVVLGLGIASRVVFGGFNQVVAAPETLVTQTTQAAPSTVTGLSVADVVAKANPAVVTITNLAQIPAGRHGGLSSDTPQPVGKGSGFILDTKGHIITNSHVVEGATELSVEFSDGTTATAKLIGRDSFQDVAVIQVDPSATVKLPGVSTLGSSASLRVGDPVVALGTPLGEFTNSATDGIVGGLDRSLDTGANYRLPNLIQHDAPISPGDSGGPLLDLNGNVIGMNVAKADTSMLMGGGQAEGIGFAIAVDAVKDVANQLIAKGEVARPYLGVKSQVDDQGRAVIETTNDGPAVTAGLRQGDIITALDGQKVDDAHPLINLLFQHKPGNTISLTVNRGGTDQKIDVTLGTRPAESQ